MYLHLLSIPMTIPKYRDKFGGLRNGEEQQHVTVSLAGMQVLDFFHVFDLSNFLIFFFYCMQGQMMNKCSCSSKLFLYDIYGSRTKVQVMANSRYSVFFFSQNVFKSIS